MDDTKGRTYAKLSELKVGDRLEADGGFTCLNPGEQKYVVSNRNGELCIACGGSIDGLDETRTLSGRRELHVLDGQLADDGDSLIGLYKVPRE